MIEATPPAAPLKYGKFAHRMIASVIDLSIVLTVALPLTDLFIAHFLPKVDMQSIVMVGMTLQSKYQGLYSLQMLVKIFTDPAFLSILRQQHIFERTVAENLLQLGFIALYILPFWFRYSSTPGKMLFRLEIVDAKTGGPLSDRQAVGRFFAYFISILPFSLGFIWIALNKRHRGFHDYLAGTLVVAKRRKTAEIQLNSSI